MELNHRYPYPVNNEHPYYINQDPLEHKKNLIKQNEIERERSSDRPSDTE
ncbi:MAG: hypothetical protein ACFB8W_13350 [Elainellaceae cyanobacterium]